MKQRFSFGPINPVRVVENADGLLLLGFRGSQFNKRFEGWVVEYALSRTNYPGRDDIPPNEPRDSAILTTENGSGVVVLIEWVKAARPGLPQVHTTWLGDRYEDYVIGYVPDRQTFLKVYRGIELVSLSWPSPGGRPTGQPNGDITPELKAAIIALVTEWRAKGHRWPWITRELDRRYPYEEYEHQWTRPGLTRWLDEAKQQCPDMSGNSHVKNNSLDSE